MYNCSGSSIRDINVVPICKSSTYNYNSGENVIKLNFLRFFSIFIFHVLGLSSNDNEVVLATYLSLLETHCQHLVTVPHLPDMPELPPDIDNRQKIINIVTDIFLEDQNHGTADRKAHNFF